MTDQTAALIAEARRLSEAATAGPWKRAMPNSNFLMCPQCEHGEYVAKAIDSMYGAPHHMDEDADFIAWARAGVPALIAALEQALDEIDDLTGTVMSVDEITGGNA